MRCADWVVPPFTARQAEVVKLMKGAKVIALKLRAPPPGGWPSEPATPVTSSRLDRNSNPNPSLFDDEF